MSETHNIVTADALGVKIAEALGLDPKRVYRVIIDAEAGHAIAVYVQMWGDTRLLEVNWIGAAGDMQVKILDDKITSMRDVARIGEAIKAGLAVGLGDAGTGV